MARYGRIPATARRWAIACTVALAVSFVLGGIHIHLDHPARTAALAERGPSDGPFIGRDCPACALAHVPAIAGDAPATLAPHDDGVRGPIETGTPHSSRDRTLCPSRGPPPTL